MVHAHLLFQWDAEGIGFVYSNTIASYIAPKLQSEVEWGIHSSKEDSLGQLPRETCKLTYLSLWSFGWWKHSLIQTSGYMFQAMRCANKKWPKIVQVSVIYISRPAGLGVWASQLEGLALRLSIAAWSFALVSTGKHSVQYPSCLW